MLAVATGGAVGMGMVENVTMTFYDPVRGDDIVNNVIEAGEYWGVAVDVSAVSRKQMEAVKERLSQTKAALEAEDYSALTKDELLGDLLYTTAMTYNAEMDVFDAIQSRTMKVSSARMPSEAVFKTSLKVESSYGVPVSVSADGLTMDVDRLTSIDKALDGNRETKVQFVRASGMNSSTLEHSVPEQMFSTPESPVDGVSAVKAIQLAAMQGIPIYTVNSSNIASVLPKLQLGQAVLDEIRNAVNAGNEVTVSQGNIDFNGWVGCGYVVVNPATGQGSYMISGGENGAMVIMMTIVALALLVVAVLAGPVALVVVSLFMPLYLALLASLNRIIGIGGTEPIDWCGTTKTESVPDYPFGIDAQWACQNHDTCYDSFDSKIICDLILGFDMSVDCNAKGHDAILCGLTGMTYTFAVIIFGRRQ